MYALDAGDERQILETFFFLSTHGGDIMALWWWSHPHMMRTRLHG